MTYFNLRSAYLVQGLGALVHSRALLYTKSSHVNNAPIIHTPAYLKTETVSAPHTTDTTLRLVVPELDGASFLRQAYGYNGCAAIFRFLERYF